MQMPLISEKNRTRRTLDRFGGYNRNQQISDGEFAHMENLSSDHYPLVSPRPRRGEYARGENIGGLADRDGLCYTEGRELVLGGYRIDLGLKPQGPKELISMGAYLLILPDKIYINTQDLTDFGPVEAFFTTSAPVTFSLCREDGTDLTVRYNQTAQPQEPENAAFWMDISGDSPVLKQWSAASGMWISQDSTWVKIASAGIGRAFSQFDGIFLKGLEGELQDAQTGQILSDPQEIRDLMGTAVIWARGDDYLVIPGILTRTRTVSDVLTLSREMPVMDFVIQRENRLWGCRYGPDSSGNVVNELYACKLGDFRNWNCFQGLSTDSYRVSLGSDGPFTGAVTYGGYPLFWKENCVHKVYGDYPGNFGVVTTGCRGVQQGSSRSLAIVDELLYYKSRHCVCAYDGSMPEQISDALGREAYSQAVAGGHGSKYYISMTDSAGNQQLLVYDTRRHLWHREDGLRAEAFCSCGRSLYCLEAGTGRILALLEPEKPLEEQVSWVAQTGPITGGTGRKKSLSRVLLRLSLEEGAHLRILVRYDSLGQWEQLGRITGRGLGSFLFPVRPRRCDHFALRLEGTGDARLFSRTEIYSQGSDRP